MLDIAGIKDDANFVRAGIILLASVL